MWWLQFEDLEEQRQLKESHSSLGPYRSYDSNYFASLFTIEDRHFWFRVRNKVIATLVSQIVNGLAPGYRVLEVGCGTGNVLRFLEQACSCGKVIGMDLFIEGLRYARKRTHCPLVQGDLSAPPFRIQFNLIGLFDVLEHLQNDMQILRNLHAVLAPAGVLLLTVPAHSSLWSYFDEASHHCRRYEFIELENKLISAGYRVDYMTQFMASVFPLAWLGRRLRALAYKRMASNTSRINDLPLRELRIVPVFNDLLAFLLNQEARVIARRRRLPIGTSLLAVACKNSGSTR